MRLHFQQSDYSWGIRLLRAFAGVIAQICGYGRPSPRPCFALDNPQNHHKILESFASFKKEILAPKQRIPLAMTKRASFLNTPQDSRIWSKNDKAENVFCKKLAGF